MIYRLRTFQNDEGMNIIERTLYNDADYKFPTYLFAGHMTMGLQAADGSVRKQQVPLSFTVEGAESIDDAFAKLPEQYKAKCQEQINGVNAANQQRKEAELRNVLMGGG